MPVELLTPTKYSWFQVLANGIWPDSTEVKEVKNFTTA